MTRDNQKLLGYTLFFFLLAHGYGLCSHFLAHDSLGEFVMISNLSDNFVGKISKGRFAQVLVYFIRGNIAVPWLVSCIAICLYALSAWLLRKLFPKIQPLLLVGLLSTNVAFAFTLGFYVHEMDMFALAIFLAVLAVYLTKNYKYGPFFAPLLLGLVCGLYQAYFSVAVALFLLLLSQEIFQGAETKQVFLKGIRWFFVLFFGLVSYYLMNFCLLKGLNISPTEMPSRVPTLSELFDLFGEEGLLTKLSLLYQEFFSFFLSPVTHSSLLVGICNLILLLSCLAILFYQCNQKKISFTGLGLFLLFLLLFPFGVNLASFFIDYSHDLMYLPFIFLYFFPLLLMEEEKITKYILSVTMLLIFWQNIIYCNQLYLRQNLAYQNTLSTMTRVLDDIEDVPDYVVGETPVLFCGVMTQSPVSNLPEYLSDLDGYVLKDSLYSVDYYEITWAYLSFILGYPVNFSQEFHLVHEAEVMEMPPFPYDGYCKMVDGVLVVNWLDRR
ncbi:MAG: glucosyltransferase domain-containing protein [Eubacteriales bacterium]